MIMTFAYLVYEPHPTSHFHVQLKQIENSKSGSDDWLREIGDRILDYEHDVRSYRLWRLGDRMQEARLAILSSLPASVTMYMHP